MHRNIISHFFIIIVLFQHEFVSFTVDQGLIKVKDQETLLHLGLSKVEINWGQGAEGDEVLDLFDRV
jgi:hypothetical protein